jgi:hypothetical protein
MLKARPDLSQAVGKFVGMAGPNHGTTVCRRSWLFWFIGWQEFVACDEITPGSPWLNELNEAQAERETPSSIASLMIYDGTGADVFYQRWLFGWAGRDQDSPALKGAKNIAMPGLTHDELRDSSVYGQADHGC